MFSGISDRFGHALRDVVTAFRTERNGDRQRHQPRPVPASPLRPFELCNDLPPGGEALAWPLTWDANNQRYDVPRDTQTNQPDPDAKILVTDRLLAGLVGAPAGARGVRLSAELELSNHDQPAYPILYVERWRARGGVLAATLAADDGSAQVLVDGETNPATAINRYHQAGAQYQRCELRPNDGDDRTAHPWILTSVDGTATSLLITADWDANQGAFSRTAIACYLPTSGATTGPTLFGQGSAAASNLQRWNTTTSEVTRSVTTPKYGQPVTLSATVSHTEGDVDPTGWVAFVLDGVLLGYGSLGSGLTATLDLNWPRASAAGLQAQYMGNGDFNGSLGTSSTVSAAKAATTIDLTCSATSATYGDGVTLSATVAAVTPSSGLPQGPRGVVSFYSGTDKIGEAAYSGGTVYLTLRRLPAKAHTLTAKFHDPTILGFGIPTGIYEDSTSDPVALSIAKATLTASVYGETRLYGDSNPGFRLLYNGWIFPDEWENLITGEPAFTCAATQSSDVGSYAIAAAAGTLTATNYTVVFHGSSLVVQPAPLFAAADDQQIRQGEPIPNLTGVLTGVKNGDSLSLNCTTEASDDSPRGQYLITPSVSGAKIDNYTIGYRAGTLTIA